MKADQHEVARRLRLMQGHKDGKAVQRRPKSGGDWTDVPCDENPWSWKWSLHDYRFKPEGSLELETA